MTEICKITNHIAPPMMSSLFEIRENAHNTRYFQVLSNESRRTVNYGLETICYRAPFLWANLPPEYKLANSLNIFKRKIKKWKGENCPCRLRKTYLRELGATFSFPVSIIIYNIFFNTKNKKPLNAQTFTEKKISVISLYYHPSIFNSFNSESY